MLHEKAMSAKDNKKIAVRKVISDFSFIICLMLFCLTNDFVFYFFVSLLAWYQLVRLVSGNISDTQIIYLSYQTSDTSYF
jgi:hypothetical protein